MKIYSFSPFGYEGALVNVEVDLRRGIPAIDLVGLADGAVKESRERMKSAIRNSGYEFPCERVLISLSPADLKKEGAGFDLPIALAVLAQKFQLENISEPILIMGELELNGKVRPIRAIHAASSTAYENGIRMCIVPKANMKEALQVKGMKVFGAESLTDAFEALKDSSLFTTNICDEEQNELPKDAVIVEGIPFAPVEQGFEFGEVKNQGRLVRALQIAAAGGHNVLAYGPPGCGKTLALQKFSALLPLLTLEEAQTVTRIYSLAGLLPHEKAIVRKAPFRMPHQTASIEGMCGGGPHCMPGEITLAHNGVLFLDEAAEYKSSVLQMLRVPLESRSITLCRAGRSTVYPAKFQLLLATNPCPCGNFGSAEKICLCSGRSIELYWKKFSGPLLDRIDFRIHVDLQEESRTTSTAELRVDIARAIKTQRNRQGKKNAQLTADEISTHCILSEEAKDFLDKQSERLGFSPRSIAGCIKVARTIADMKGEDLIQIDSIKEAVEFRQMDEAISF